MFDYLVIGKGLMGAAATRYLSQASPNVAVIGPDEPPNPATHAGLFGAHYDQARIISQAINREPIWASLSRHTLTQLPQLEAILGEKIWHPIGCLFVAPQDMAADLLTQDTDQTGHVESDYEVFDQVAQQQAFPYMRFAANETMVWEKGPAGRLNPRKLLQGELKAARQNGATLIREIAERITDHGEYVAVTTREGGLYQARKILIATGAFSNCFHLFERPPALRLKIEYVIMGEIPPAEVERLRPMPPLSYQIRSPKVADLYMFPPVQYPDGKFYLKMGANTVADRYVETLDDICDWYRTGESDVMLADMREVVYSILPGLQALSWHTGRCVITRTAHAKPYIDAAVPGKIYTAIGGNGTSAQAADGIGKLAADLVTHDSWQSELDPHAFRLCYADDAIDWANRELMRGDMAL